MTITLRNEDEFDNVSPGTTRKVVSFCDSENEVGDAMVLLRDQADNEDLEVVSDFRSSTDGVKWAVSCMVRRAPLTLT